MEEFFDKLLRYGMFLGAIFQLVCIAAVIILPEQMKNHRVCITDKILLLLKVTMLLFARITL